MDIPAAAYKLNSLPRLALSQAASFFLLSVFRGANPMSKRRQPIDPEREEYEQARGMGADQPGSDASSPSSASTAPKQPPRPRKPKDAADGMSQPPVPPPFTVETATVKALETALGALQDSNSKLRERLDAEWLWAKSILVVAGGVVTLMFGMNFYREYVVVSELRRRSNELHKQVEDSKLAVAKLNEDLAVIKRRHDAALSESTLADANGIEATDAALQVAMFIDYAQDQLSYKQNPQRAWDYANQAETTLNAARANFSEDHPLGTSLDKLAPAIYSMKAQCAWKLGAMDKVEAAAKAAIMAAKDFSSSDALEANYYMGLAELKRAIDEDAVRGKRQDMLSEAVESLRKAAAGKNLLHTGGQPQLFLIAAMAEAGRYRAAVEEADAFLKGFPKGSVERKRLDKELQAQISLATTWRTIAEFCNNNGGALEIPSCGMEVGAIGTREGEMFDLLLEQFVRFKDGRVRHPIAALELGYYCADMMGTIRTASQSAGCGGAPGGEAPEDVAARYNFEVPFSTDESLGVIRNGVLAMKYIEYRTIEKKRDREADGRTYEETYTDQESRVVACELDDAERPIPSRRYIPYELDDKYLPFKFASSEFVGEASAMPPAPIAAEDELSFGEDEGVPAAPADPEPGPAGAEEDAPSPPSDPNPVEDDLEAAPV